MNSEKEQILLVDDDAAHRSMLRLHLATAGYAVSEAEDGDIALALLERQSFSLVLLDMRMERVDGLEALGIMSESYPQLPVIMVTAFSSVETAVEAMRQGAFDYLTKPVDVDQLLLVVERALKNRQLVAPRAEGLAAEPPVINGFVGKGSRMRELVHTLGLVAPSEARVLIQGESGTGKELLADAVHRNSQRRAAPLIKLNCATLHENLLESELFGHEKGAFSGAASRRQGRFELADGGTLFLDEIGDMSLATQAKVLRVIQQGEFERLGGSVTLKVDVRIIAATHRDLRRMVDEGSFRQDLYFRLAVVPLDLPPLRERQEDIPSLTELFVKRYAERNRKQIDKLSGEALTRLMAWHWPGNIRELENCIERAIILCPGEQIGIQDLPAALREFDAESVAVPPAGTSLKEMERRLIIKTLEQTGGNRTRAAELLGITRQTLQNKVREYGLLRDH
jgi:two-component system response regulator HydG